MSFRWDMGNVRCHQLVYVYLSQIHIAFCSHWCYQVLWVDQKRNKYQWMIQILCSLMLQILRWIKNIHKWQQMIPKSCSLMLPWLDQPTSDPHLCSLMVSISGSKHNKWWQMIQFLCSLMLPRFYGENIYRDQPSTFCVNWCYQIPWVDQTDNK